MDGKGTKHFQWLSEVPDGFAKEAGTKSLAVWTKLYSFIWDYSCDDSHLPIIGPVKFYGRREVLEYCTRPGLVYHLMWTAGLNGHEPATWHDVVAGSSKQSVTLFCQFSTDPDVEVGFEATTHLYVGTYNDRQHQHSQVEVGKDFGTELRVCATTLADLMELLESNRRRALIEKRAAEGMDRYFPKEG